jgi:esterase/lipase
MSSRKVSFTNSDNQRLSAIMEIPDQGAPIAYALFAHCFTCNKNFTAVKNIGRALNSKGIAVLRFDFSGLGESEGDFENTNFSSNIEDLLSAAAFLNENFEAPNILIGHSLGGAAAIYAASILDSVKVVATVGTPSDPSHVTHLFENRLAHINEHGIANVSIGGRSFTIKKQFLDDINEKNMQQTVHHLGKPILILHSPQDNTVSIDNAATIYQAARHPKSFISLDGADHLLSRPSDSAYVGSMIAAWSERYIINLATLTN